LVRECPDIEELENGDTLYITGLKQFVNKTKTSKDVFAWLDTHITVSWRETKGLLNSSRRIFGKLFNVPKKKKTTGKIGGRSGEKSPRF